MIEWESVHRTEAADWQIQTWLTKIAQGCACEREKESLANWLLEVCLYHAYLERVEEPQEIAVLTTERLWQSITSGALTWREDSGLSGLLRYIRQAVQFEIGRHRRSLQRDRTAVVPLESIIEMPDPDDYEHAVVERLDQEALTEATRAAIAHLSPQQQLVVRLRMEGLEPREIAEVVHIPRTQVNVVLAHAYARLRQILLAQAETNSALAATLEQVFNIRLTTEAASDGEGT
jgi:RNA polymerase sigma factor (sigma-70 family)